MAGAPLPGRPGNLTPEQEEKLKDFWIALFHVFGVSDGAADRGADASRPESQKANPEVASSDKAAKKKRQSLFGRKHDESTGGSIADGEDKYGQNKEFQKTLETYKPEELRQAFWNFVKFDDPDAVLLRFLRARKWNVQNALVMLVATIHWRLSEVKVDSDIVPRGELGALEDSESADAKVKKEGHDFLEQLRIGKSFLHGTDKDGRPMCIVRVRLHRAGEQTEKSLERYTVYTIETARTLLHDNIDTAVSPVAILHCNELMNSGHRFRHDRFFDGKHGLRPSPLHDQMLRSQLSRVARSHPSPQISLDLPIDLEDHPRLA